MRFALVAGALVLGATVTEARSIAPSPSKRTAEKIEFSTPSRNLKRARHDDGDWNPATEADDAPSNQDSMDPSAYQSKTPSGGKSAKKSHKASKDHKSSNSDGVNRSALPDSLAMTADPVADTLSKKLPQDIQYQIIPVASGNSSGKDSSASDERAYIIKPVSPTAMLAAAEPTEVKQTLDGVTPTPDLNAVVDHLKTKEESKPALALLRAIEKYRLAVSQEAPDDVNGSQSRSATLKKPVNMVNSVLHPVVKGQKLPSPLGDTLDSIPGDAAGLPTDPSPLPSFNPADSLDNTPLANVADSNVLNSAPSDSNSEAAWDQ
ncbi:hypothetical protein PGT21_018146 [Puccinia graminis f. sp. tritici]|uniref:Uncharacterized protein n=2 Tax=Puccinia graminis f. sp. tritici TaxID=56615 RepID=A0A5B0LVC7_PUCGR|nr:hypothetical protein PGT21_018146 [Puccinia graminis f. sp. tritici]KAA1093427.1 hypothetical protein PGTUg99_012719 [Puccinia graminis f. sp. tritici]